MSAESERVFSGARRTIPWTRASLSAKVIEQLECLKHWQRAGVVSKRFEDEMDELGEGEQQALDDVNVEPDM